MDTTEIKALVEKLKVLRGRDATLSEIILLLSENEIDVIQECGLNYKNAIIESNYDVLYLADIYWGTLKKDDKHRINCLYKLVESDSNSIHYSNLGNLLVSSGMIHQAIRYYDEAVKFDPNYPIAYIARGDAFFTIGQFENALLNYNKALSINPKLDLAYHNKGVVYFKLGDFDKSILEFNQAIKLNPNDSTYYRNQGNTHIKLRQFDLAIWSYDKGLQINPKDLEANNNKGFAYFGLKQYQNALATFEKTITFDENNSIAYSGKGIVFNALEQYENALQSHEKAIELDSKCTNAFSGKGDVLLKLKQYDLAILNYNQAIETNPFSSGLHCALGRAYSLAKQYKDALACYDISIKLNPQNADAFKNIGETCLMLGEFDNSLFAFTKALELNPHCTDSYYGRGYVFYSCNNYALALKEFDDVLSLDSKHALSYIGKGDVLSAQLKYEAAILSYDKAIEIDPNLWNAYHGKSRAYLKTGNFHQAYLCCSKALELGPFEFVLWNTLADVYNSTDRQSEAINCLEKSIQITPTQSDAYIILGLIKSKVSNILANPYYMCSINKGLKHSSTSFSFIRYFARTHPLIALELLEEMGCTNEFLAMQSLAYEITLACKGINKWLRYIEASHLLLPAEERNLLIAVINYHGGNPIYCNKLIHNFISENCSLQTVYYYLHSYLDIFPEIPYNESRIEIIQQAIRRSEAIINDPTANTNDYYYAMHILIQQNIPFTIDLNRITTKAQHILAKQINPNIDIKAETLEDDFLIPDSTITIKPEAKDWSKLLNKIVRCYEIAEFLSEESTANNEYMRFWELIDYSLLDLNSANQYLYNLAYQKLPKTTEELIDNAILKKMRQSLSPKATQFYLIIEKLPESDLIELMVKHLDSNELSIRELLDICILLSHEKTNKSESTTLSHEEVAYFYAFLNYKGFIKTKFINLSFEYLANKISDSFLKNTLNETLSSFFLKNLAWRIAVFITRKLEEKTPVYVDYLNFKNDYKEIFANEHIIYYHKDDYLVNNLEPCPL